MPLPMPSVFVYTRYRLRLSVCYVLYTPRAKLRNDKLKETFLEPVNVFDYEALAQVRMEPAAWDYYQSGVDDEVTLRANSASFGRIRLRQRVLVDVSTCDMRTTVLGTPVSMPILIAPTGFQCLAHPEGECVTAQAAGNMDTLMVASSSATRSLEDTTRPASSPLWL